MLPKKANPGESLIKRGAKNFQGRRGREKAPIWGRKPRTHCHFPTQRLGAPGQTWGSEKVRGNLGKDKEGIALISKIPTGAIKKEVGVHGDCRKKEGGGRT